MTADTIDPALAATERPSLRAGLYELDARMSALEQSGGGALTVPLLLALSESDAPSDPLLIVTDTPTGYDDFLSVGLWQVIDQGEPFRAQEVFAYTQNDDGTVNADVDAWVNTTQTDSVARVVAEADNPTYGQGIAAVRVDVTQAFVYVQGRSGQTAPVVDLRANNNDPVWTLTPQGVLNGQTPGDGDVITFDAGPGIYVPAPLTLPDDFFPAVNRFHMGPTADETGIGGNDGSALLATAEERHNGNDGDLTNPGGGLSAQVPTSGVYAITFALTANTENNGGIDTFLALNYGVTISDDGGVEHVKGFGLGESAGTNDTALGNVEASVTCTRYIESNGFASVTPFVSARVDGAGDHKWTLSRFETSLSVQRVG